MPAKTPLSFYFDPVSPYVWLAARQMEVLEARCTLHWTPVLFAGLLNAHGQKGPAEIPAKRDYTFRDVMRQAAQLGIPFAGPPGHPFNPLLALRMCTAVAEQPLRQRLARALLAAAWEHGLDISQASVAEQAAAHAGLDGAALIAQAQTPAIKQRLAEATERAIAAGVFGVPTWCAGEAMFWGADRIPSLLWHLDGHRIDEQVLAQFLARPPLAQR